MGDLTLYLLIAAIICAVVGNYIAKEKGRSTAEGFLFGFFGGVIGLIIVALLPTKNKQETQVEIKENQTTVVESEEKDQQKRKLKEQKIMIF